MSQIFHVLQGVSGIFCSDTDAETSTRCPDPPPLPPYSPKDMSSRIWRQKSKFGRQNSNILYPKVKIWRSIQISQNKIRLKFLYHQNPPVLYEENSKHN